MVGIVVFRLKIGWNSSQGQIYTVYISISVSDPPTASQLRAACAKIPALFLASRNPKETPSCSSNAIVQHAIGFKNKNGEEDPLKSTGFSPRKMNLGLRHWNTSSLTDMRSKGWVGNGFHPSADVCARPLPQRFEEYSVCALTVIPFYSVITINLNTSGKGNGSVEELLDRQKLKGSITSDSTSNDWVIGDVAA